MSEGVLVNVFHVLVTCCVLTVLSVGFVGFIILFIAGIHDFIENWSFYKARERFFWGIATLCTSLLISSAFLTAAIFFVSLTW